jgi:hypothetical protein
LQLDVAEWGRPNGAEWGRTHFHAVHKEPETRRRLLKSEEDYRLALRSREVLRQVRSAAVCHGSPFMSMFFGMDNRTLLPPYFPLGRNEDGTFGYLVGRCLEGSYSGYLPWSLVHDPPTWRSYFGNPAETVRISDLAIACISTWTWPNRGAGAAERLFRQLLTFVLTDAILMVIKTPVAPQRSNLFGIS